MVKGVNKRVIEVNDTGNKFFEKIVFYVTAEYSDLSPTQLKEATKFLNLGFDENRFNMPLRKRRRLRRKRIAFFAVLGSCLIIAGIILAIIL